MNDDQERAAWITAGYAAGFHGEPLNLLTIESAAARFAYELGYDRGHAARRQIHGTTERQAALTL